MIYNDFKGLKIPEFGFGAMRLPVIDGDDAKVDVPQTQRMVDYALEHGVNYFDTGYDYHSGNSEVELGRALARHPRESFMLADKYPGYNLAHFGKNAQVFEQQLERCGVDYFDFYMLHNVCELNIEQYLDDAQYQTVSYLVGERDAGRIKHFGLSSHGNLNTLRRILQRYGGAFEFCQLQLNWLDWDFQSAREKVALCADYGLPVIVMEPLRGGKLVELSDDALARLEEARPGKSAVDWSFRFVQSVPEVLTVLSGVSSFEQLEQNIATFETDEPLTADEREVLQGLSAEMTSKNTVPCTACRYCTSHCPLGLDIPGLIDLYNEHKYSGGGFIAPMALGGLPEGKRPAACIGCGSCESFCPQSIKVSQILHDFAETVQAWG